MTQNISLIAGFARIMGQTPSHSYFVPMVLRRVGGQTHYSGKALIATFVIVATLLNDRAGAEEKTTSTSLLGAANAIIPSLKGFQSGFTGISQGILGPNSQQPRHSRVSRSRQHLRQVTLLSGDRFVSECLEWTTERARFRLLSGQTILVPIAAIRTVFNPPGEVDLTDESFEAGSPIESDPVLLKMLDETHAADGKRSLRFDSSSADYQPAIPQRLGHARVEFSFQVVSGRPDIGCGEWQFVWDTQSGDSSVLIRLKPDCQIEATEPREVHGGTFQELKLSEGWHSLVTLTTPEWSRLIVDDAILASFPTTGSSLKSILFRPQSVEMKNAFWIDELKVRSLIPVENDDQPLEDPISHDVIQMANGDELNCRLNGQTRQAVLFDAYDEKQRIIWNRIAGLIWQQPGQPVGQVAEMTPGIVARIEMQGFVDRLECEPELWTATIVKVDSQQLVVSHELVGELMLRWEDVRKVEPMFVGQTKLVDARRFHLGNSIRSDFHRHQPDGTEIRLEFTLHEIVAGPSYFSVVVAEMEAASPNAPPGSPFLKELRTGQLVTEVLVNEIRIGELNSQIRFKSSCQKPERIRLPIPRGLLRMGDNSIRLRQQPIKYGSREYDDCEVGCLRLEFESQPGIAK